MTATKEPVRFAPEAAHIPVWDAKHPLFTQYGSTTYHVETAHGGKAYVEIPAVGDERLAQVIAALAVYFGGVFIKSHRDMGYVIAEYVAQAYEALGGTPEGWCAYVESLGVQIAPQSDNNFITVLRVLTGTANDPSRRLGKLAQFIDRWTVIRREGGGDWPSPQIGDDMPGTSEMTRWAKHMDGWSKIARRHAKWREERICPRCGVPYKVAGNVTCPICDRATDDLGPLDGDIRVIGFHIDLDEGGEPSGSEWEAVHAEHPDAQHWDIKRYEPAVDEYSWVTIADWLNSREEAEAEANRFRSEQYRSSEAPETPKKPNRPPESDGSLVEKRPGDGSPATGAAANAKSESIKQNPAAKGKNPNPPKNPARADWTGGAKGKQQETVVNLEAVKARREAEEAAKKVADLEQKLTEAERRTAAAGPQPQWCEAPDDFAKAAVSTDVNAAIDAMEALQDALRGTPEWRAYQDDLFKRFAQTANKIKEERDAERRAELAADLKEQRIARIKNALYMALRPDTDEHQRNAAFAGVLRMCEDGDLSFLDRLSTEPPDPAPPTARIAAGSPIDLFLKASAEQLRQYAEQYADRLAELRAQIGAFLKALNAVDPRKKEAVANG
jgi:hypothetical protein